MLQDAGRSRPGPDLAFALLRALRIGYCLWGPEANVSLVELLHTSRAQEKELAWAIASLADLNLVTVDGARHTIRLSATAVRDLLQPSLS